VGQLREDYSPGGDSWNYFTHDQARSRASRWGEDGIAGICDEHQRLRLALALWNGTDRILKERMFGLTNGEGNHEEDVKEYWFYLDSTLPTPSQVPIQEPAGSVPLRGHRVHARRGKQDLEYELLDTGIFAEDRHFDLDRGVRQGRPGRHSHAGRRVRVADQLLARQRTIDRDDFAVGVDAYELEASEVEQQCAAQPCIASPLGCVATLVRLWCIERPEPVVCNQLARALPDSANVGRML
jgi:hypothetical protein